MNNSENVLKSMKEIRKGVFICKQCDCNAYSFNDFELWIKNMKLCGKCYETTTGKIRHYR